MNKEQDSVQILMGQLISARDPEEARELTAQVRRLSAQTASPEERLEMYHQAHQAVRARLLEMAEKKNLGPVVSVLLQADKKIQRGGYYGEKLPESSRVAHDLLGLLRPISAALEDAKDPMTVEYIIRQARGLLADAENQKQREAGSLLLCQMLENEVLGKYLEEIRSYDKLFDEPEPEERFLSSLLRALEAPANPALALSLLQYDIDHDTFCSVTPAKLVEIDKKDALMTAIMTYMAATHKVTRQEAADCETELKHCILLQFLHWLEREKLVQYSDIRVCVYFLRKILTGVFDAESWSKWESFSYALDAISSAIYLASETDIGTLESDCAEQAEHIAQCNAINRPIGEFTAFALVIRLCERVRHLHVQIPPMLECLLKLYLYLQLSSDNTINGFTCIWITAEDRKANPDK